MTHAIAPTLPQAFVSAKPGAVTGSTFTVNAGGDFNQALIDAAAADQSLHHEIVLQAGATFSGNFEPPANKTGVGWVTIRSSQSAALPASGTRVDLSHAPLMAKIQTPNGAPCMNIADPSSGWRFHGIDFTIAPGVSVLFHMVGMGLVNGGNSFHVSLATIGRRFSFEQCLFRPLNDNTRCLRALYLNGGDVRIEDCSIYAMHHELEAQGIECQDSPGPILIENNYVEGAGENIMFGGGPASPGVTPSDIIIRRNHLFKPLSWQGDPRWNVKNLFELKHARRILVEGNLMENCWQSQQDGVALGFSINNGEGSVEDVTFQHNIIKNATGFIFFWERVVPFVNSKRRIKLYNNLGLAITSNFIPNFAVETTYEDIWIEHNTVVPLSTHLIHGSGMNPPQQRQVRMTVKNNLFGIGAFGPGIETFGASQAAWDLYAPDREFAANMLLALSGGAYGGPLADGMVRRGTAAAEGLNLTTGQLDPSSPFKAGNAFDATDDTDIGVNFPDLALAQGGELDETAPTVPGTPTLVTALSTALTITWTASTDAVGVAGYDIRRDGVVVGGSVTNSFTDTGLEPETEYSYTVRARDAWPNFSAYSSALVAETAAASAATPEPPGVMRGFGPTRGVSLTDRITIPLAAHAVARTYAFWVRINGFGNQYGDIFSKGADEFLYVDAATGTLIYWRQFSGGPATTWSTDVPSFDTRHLVIVKYSSASLSNTPVMKVDDDFVHVSLDTVAPTGTVVNNTTPYTFGNYHDGQQGFDGDLAKIAVYDFLTSDAEDTELFEGVDPLTVGAGPVAYHAFDGTVNEPDGVTPFGASTVVGTQVQIYEGATLSVDVAVSAGDPATGTDYQVTATVTGGTPDRVEFWVDGALFRTDSATAFVLFAAGGGGVLGPGTHTIEARVFPDAGLIPDDTDTLQVTEPAATAGSWTVPITWQRVTDAVSYTFSASIAGTPVITDAVVLQPVTGDPVYAAVFSAGSGDVTVSYAVTAVFAGAVEGPAMAWRDRYIVTTGETVAVVAPTGHQELSRTYTP